MASFFLTKVSEGSEYKNTFSVESLKILLIFMNQVDKLIIQLTSVVIVQQYQKYFLAILPVGCLKDPYILKFINIDKIITVTNKNIVVK